MRARSALVVVSLVALSLGTAAPPAQGAQHFMKVREVYAGSLLDANADFVELQMYQVGQTVLTGHILLLYDQSGAHRDCTIPSNVTNGANQETILFATTQAQAAFGTADFTIPAFLNGDGGAVCWENFDCVSWGTFPGGASDINGGPGTPEPGGISVGDAIDRRTDISGDPGMLEAADDTNNSANDFESEGPTPNPNGPVNLGTANCTPAGGGGGDTFTPSSKINKPKHKSDVLTSKSKKLSGTARDQGGSGVAKVEIALRQKLQGGCKWWNGSRFVNGGCNQKLFVMGNGEQSWKYTLSKRLKPTGDGIKNYILYSRATDGAGNVEPDFLPGRNKSKFEVIAPPKVCCAPPG